MMRALMGSPTTARRLLLGRQAGFLTGRKLASSDAGQRSRSRRAPPLRPVARADYIAIATDNPVLQKPPRQELLPDEIANVFRFPRDLHVKYDIGKVLGAGSFGVVRECWEIKTRVRYAVKTIPKTPKRGRPTPRYLLKMQQEVDAMQQVGASLDAVFLKDVFEDNESIHIVMEVCDGGPLLGRLRGNKASERYIASLVRSITRFVSQCHARGLMYRDVKPDNFLFVTADENSSLKATDFGLSIRHTPDEPVLRSRSGTPAYMAPEVIMQSYTAKADVWSVGMVTYQLLTGRFPFTENIRECSLQEVWHAILNEDIDFSELEKYNLSPAAISFLRRTLEHDPSRRVSAAEALQLPFLQDTGQLPDLPLRGTVVARLQRFATYSHLKQMVLRMITDEIRLTQSFQETLSDDDYTGVMSVFKSLDVDGNGNVSLEELTKGLKEQGYNLTDEEVRQLMERLDLNHDGEASFTELAASLIDWADVVGRLKRDDWERLVDAAFDRMDADGNGYISIGELLRQMQPDFQGMPDSSMAAEAQRMLRDADTNGDGMISQQEFHRLLNDGTPDLLGNYDTRLMAVDPIDEEVAMVNAHGI